jgi:hypothetical protein
MSESLQKGWAGSVLVAKITPVLSKEGDLKYALKTYWS